MKLVRGIRGFTGPMAAGANLDDAMHMIGHHHKFMQQGMWIVDGDRLPAGISLLSCLAKEHTALTNLPKKTFLVEGTFGHKIQPFRCIVMPLQTYRPTVMICLVVSLMHSVNDMFLQT